jgi:hypothetical protein
MRHHRFLAIALAFTPAIASAQSGLAYDFKLTENAEGQPKTNVGHALVLGNNVRMDIYGASSFSSFGLISLGDTVSVISADTGEAQLLSLVGKTSKEYVQFAPVRMMKKMKEAMAQMGGGPQMDFTGSQVTVDSLGSGGMIAGYNTLHYRTTIAMRIGMGGQPMGDQNIVTDYYIAPDLKEFVAGTSIMTASTNEVSAMPGMPKSLSDQIIAAGSRTSGGMALRIETSTTGSMMGTGLSKKQMLEVTSVSKIDVPASTFVVPADYKKLVPPGMESMM